MIVAMQNAKTTGRKVNQPHHVHHVNNNDRKPKSSHFHGHAFVREVNRIPKDSPSCSFSQSSEKSEFNYHVDDEDTAKDNTELWQKMILILSEIDISGNAIGIGSYYRCQPYDDTDEDEGRGFCQCYTDRLFTINCTSEDRKLPTECDDNSALQSNWTRTN